ncbi:ABC transporter substrate-binding protein [Salinigranum marinum]|uniref:ABC transporter substrate-binding protein n=1 Tax=Salinigranum marinum TaxID=1515595 RepID=UPI002989B1DD|nr:ABC transporter substrate-binding protein [Salinigranum marinum]
MSARHVVVFTLSVVLVAAVVPLGAGPATAQESGGCSFPVSETDATGTTVTLSGSPDRIVTLNPSAAQTVYEISASDDPAWDRVVGVSQFASYLPGTAGKTTVGNGRSDATVERTVALAPDLVLAPNTIPDPTVQQLRDAGLTVFKFRPADSIDGDASASGTTVTEKTRLIGRLVGECDGARDTADTMERELDIVRDALRDEERPKALYYFFSFTAGSDTFIDEIITTAGVENVAAAGGANEEQSSGFFVVNAETVVAEDPEWFLLNSNEYREARVPAGPNGAFTETTAYEEDNAVVLDANEISQPAPRVVNAVLDVVKVVHPEAYREEIRGRLDRSEEPGGAKQVRTTALADGSVRLEARNLGRDKRVSFSVPDRPNATVQLQRVNVSLANLNPTFTVDVRYPRADDGPTPLDGTRELARFSMDANGLPNEDIDRLRVRFVATESALAARNVSAENVTLYRHNGSSWAALETRVVGSQNGSVVFETTSATPATFSVAVPETTSARAVTATPTPEPTPTATSTTEPATTRPTAAPPSTTVADTTGTDAPGFGVVAVIAALVAALAVARLD